MSDPLTERDLRRDESDTTGAQIRKTHSIKSFWKREREFGGHQTALPNCVIHTDRGSKYGHPGGTNWLAVGKKGSGKTTLALWLASHLLKENQEIVIWRGSQARSEWLPFKHWTTLCLPSECAIDASWVSSAVTKRGRDDAQLEEIVDEVVYYDDLEDLLSTLDKETFAVVYPDPLFRGCTAAMRQSSYAKNHIEYTSRADAEDPSDATPLIHWWIALALAIVDAVPEHRHWTSLIFDEVADLLPESAKSERNQTYEKLQAIRGAISDTRKYNFSFFCFAHSEINVHYKIRHTFDWRVAMPDPNGNPSQRNGDNPPVGFEFIPMKENVLRDQGPGHAICWRPDGFTPFSWEDVSVFEEDLGRTLRIEIAIADGGAPHARVSESEPEPGGVADD